MDLIISHVVAMSNNWVIGVNNDLPWSLKDDLAHFKKYTTGKIIVMGRKTYESIGRPLPNRVNYVISSTLKDIEGVSIFTSLENAIEAAKIYNLDQDIANEVAIIGGGYLFRDSIDSFNKLILTRVDCSIDGDVYYPEIDFSNWELISSDEFLKNEDNQYDFAVETYKKIMTA
ncbi:MAG: dihydrofolate reductase [SAR86 cluster bacterium]|uniref:Dihydrofolate reductase n=1 Tax=SAR86 cluster bacterium TaxID=2030880 RepID=A0A937JB55_9GAMM|nr:dihydrofolate reductase [SAR86 cluster bacterium]